MMFITWLPVIFVFFQSIYGGHIETVAASGCQNCSIHLTCRRFTSIIGILEASFVPDTVSNSTIVSSFPLPYPRQCLNRRCSGNNYCSFILVEDCPGANFWGEGTLYIKYVCIEDDRIIKYCNSDIILPDLRHTGISEGFIRNPGYPRFYGGQSPCRWRIKAPTEQKIKLTILDISVIIDNPSNQDDCTKDHLEIIDSDIVVYSTCQQREPPEEIISISDSLEVVLTSSQRLTPLRGILLYYTALGCPTPIPPADSYLVFINDTFAVFSCCVGYVFPDTGTKSRELHCWGSKWNEMMPLPNCEQLEFPVAAVEPLPTFPKMAADIVAPILIIGALIVINSIVLFFIYRAKQKNETKIKDEEIGALNSKEMTHVL
ncbi:hypothetical protein WA026_000834 [Henosepilachna vigintioctopunctata]|uniref:CUB domain-containing protein n=1 Tax=Henosepilachna vigintioctopunctata TaxID=420089 RepID=A0AAW1V9M4_9CUCU